MYQNYQYAVGRDQLEKLGGEVRRGVMLWLTPRLVDFIAQHPDIKPQVITQTQAPDHTHDAFDIVIRRGRDDWAPAIEARSLFEDELLLVAAPSLIERLALQDLASLSRHTLLTA